MRLLPVLATLLVATQVFAQTQGPQQAAPQTNDDEFDQRLYDAEQRMAEAARQMTLLTAERLPHLAGGAQRFEFIGDDRPRLGVMIGDDAEGAVKGVAIVGVTPGGAAAEAGLRAGDVITAVNGESMAGDSSAAATQKLLDFMEGVEDGDTLALDYLRDGKAGKVEVEPRLARNQWFGFGDGGGMFGGPVFSAPGTPGAPGTMIAPRAGGPNQYVFEWHSNGGWGDMELVQLNAGLGKYFGTEQGLLVVNAPESRALQLEDGDVIQKIGGREPSSVRHALRILGSYQAGEKLELQIMRDKKRMTLQVEVPVNLSSGLQPAAEPSTRPARAPTARLQTPVEKT